MSIESLFDHVCDIYHLNTSEQSLGYGLPKSPTFSYESKADVKGVPCHFNIRQGNDKRMVQREPQNELTERIKLNLPEGTDIRINDKVVDVVTGLEYTVASPAHNIRDNHLFVYVERIGLQKAL